MVYRRRIKAHRRRHPSGRGYVHVRAHHRHYRGSSHRKSSGRYWIAGSIKRPGALRRAAARVAGGLTRSGHVNTTKMIAHARRTGNTRLLREAVMARTLRGLPRHVGPRGKRHTTRRRTYRRHRA